MECEELEAGKKNSEILSLAGSSVAERAVKTSHLHLVRFSMDVGGDERGVEGCVGGRRGSND